MLGVQAALLATSAQQPATALKFPVERLWAPWRQAYVTSTSGGDASCIFCHAFEPGRDELILVRGRVSFVNLQYG